MVKLIKNKTFGLKFWSMLQFISTVNIAKVKIICHVNCEPCQNMRLVPTSFELCSHMLRWQRKFFWGYLLLHNAVSQIYNSGLYFCGFLAIHLISHIFVGEPLWE